ncbi:MAG: hypothetical protein AAF988_02725 [Pseudomonadota bacterium]
MSQVVKKKKVQQVLEETNDAYRFMHGAERSKTDYADYASANSLSSFQNALHDPDLTYDRLCKMLRRASIRETHRQCNTPWSSFMASYIEKRANAE